jgi:predicted transcriptional regulator
MAGEAKTTLRLAPELNGRLRAVADREHRSVHAQVLVYIGRGLAADEAKSSSEGEGPG